MTVAANSWMSHVPDKHLYDLLIPGTHDTGTEGFPVGSPSRTQYYKINEQLEAGVRFLDLRLAYNSVESNFHVVHSGDVASNLNFDTVVKWCADFLANHPTETILMSVKQEGSRPGSDAAFAKELGVWHDAHVAQRHWKQDLWYTHENDIPTVDQAKSRIVLLRRYTVAANWRKAVAVLSAPLPYQGFYEGLNLEHINRAPLGTFLIAQPLNRAPTPNPLPGVFCSYQDQYEQSGDEKKKSIATMLSHMAVNTNYLGHNRRWFINFASTANPGPLRAANDINPWLEEQLKNLRAKIYGVLVTDYAQPELWKKIYETNFRVFP